VSSLCAAVNSSCLCSSSTSLSTELATVGEGGEVLSLLESDVEGDLDSKGKEVSRALLTAFKSCWITASPEKVWGGLWTVSPGIVCTEFLIMRKADVTVVLIEISFDSPISLCARSLMAFLSILPVEVLGIASKNTIPPFSCL